MKRRRKEGGIITGSSNVTSFVPRRGGGGRERAPGTHCLYQALFLLPLLRASEQGYYCDLVDHLSCGLVA